MSVGITSALADDIDFNRDIRPILSENCFHCHGPSEKGRKAKLRLDLPEVAYAEREGVRAIVPGDLKRSEVAYRIRATDAEDLMPPSDSHYALVEFQKVLIEQWIKAGAEYKGHWAFIPPKPDTTQTIQDLIDNEIRARLSRDRLKPSPGADRETLIRRLSLDVRGLPPTLKEVDDFLTDTSARAWETLVDRMLASTACAERLALDWLDVARYADSNGYSIDDHREMWVWRDWVIHAFMQNKPYDEFLLEQLAGDLLPEATPQQKMATGFLRNSMNTHEGGTLPEEYRVAYLVDKVDTVASTFLGLTLKCAQCHDHKYDPITQKDYYRFYAFFNSATEKGMGAENGNTAPVIKTPSPLQNDAQWAALLSSRIARLTSIRNHLHEREPESFEAWKSGVLEKYPATTLTGGAEALLSRREFSLPEGPEQPDWIWSEASGSTLHIQFRKALVIKEDLQSAYVYFSVDNSADLYVNGRKAGHIAHWNEPPVHEITTDLHAGTNVIAIDAVNSGGVGGLIAWVQLDYRGEPSTYVLSDTNWLWTPSVDRGVAESLSADAEWRAPVSLGKYGVEPWQRLEFNGEAGVSLEKARAHILRKDPALRSAEEQTLVTDAFSRQAGSELNKRFVKDLSIEIGSAEKQLKEGGQASVMIMDVNGANTAPILIRGQYDQPGEEVSAGVPEIFPQLPEGEVPNRLALARWMIADEQPLTARVAVNRYWQMIFGTGLVRTSEDFGAQGEWPSHLQLLDTLAVRFREDGWDVKQLLKAMVMSETYQQCSEVSAHALDVDPENRLLARAPRQRLQAELLRDNALAISGLLNPTIGGPSVFPDQPDGLWRQISHFGHGVFTAQSYYADIGDSARRRSMYTFWKRTAPPPNMAIF
ncbi:MAG: DUF1549 domain-containing protein, partial [Verrucomicrobia bacterium]|nr:DUF1549 domain-containing protein [Verrucomicrobiota bacterium]